MSDLGAGELSNTPTSHNTLNFSCSSVEHKNNTGENYKRNSKHLGTSVRDFVGRFNSGGKTYPECEHNHFIGKGSHTE